jgi:hypothetical protein
VIAAGGGGKIGVHVKDGQTLAIAYNVGLWNLNES